MFAFPFIPQPFMKKVLLAMLLAVLNVQAQVSYPLGPDSQPQDGAPKGTITKYKLAPGKIYPGAPHARENRYKAQ
jgi:hypothetical protein